MESTALSRLSKLKEKIDTAVEKNPEIDKRMVIIYLKTADDEEAKVAEQHLCADEFDKFATRVKEKVVREVIRSRIKEVVRKKPGGGGYVLYSPNKGKKAKSRAVGSFPTKLGAKRAELARFPPKDEYKLKRLRREIDKLMKDPKKQAEREKPKAVKAVAKAKKESVDISVLRTAVAALVKESLYQEDREDSRWSDELSRLSKTAVANDPKLQSLQKGIEKRTAAVLDAALSAVTKGVDRKNVKIKAKGKETSKTGQQYLVFSATMGNVVVEPLAISIEGGYPKIELSPDAKAALTKVDPSVSKLFRADLVQVQEKTLDKIDDLVSATQTRDGYLEKMESQVDAFVSQLNPLQVSILKSLLTKKYRKA